jgi:hypothetical protein
MKKNILHLTDLTTQTTLEIEDPTSELIERALQRLYTIQSDSTSDLSPYTGFKYSFEGDGKYSNIVEKSLEAHNKIGFHYLLVTANT